MIRCLAPFLFWCIAIQSCIGANATCGQHRQLLPETKVAIPDGAVIRFPCTFRGELTGHEGLIVVPENRSVAKSRKIVVHFLRFPSRKPKQLAPVFILLGGPGDACSRARINREYPRPGQHNLVREVIEFSKHRDVIIMNRRGNPKAPGLQSDGAHIFGEPGKFSVPFSIADASKQLREGAKATFDRWTAMGMDLAGYDIINLVETSLFDELINK